ncbi:MAG TPA: hypothetical protein VEQ60_31170, partial [Longimicrobium sp.]|nr:hypothetical protein [Longimicrobium sp.]
RVHGVPAYVAGRAADVAAGTDPAGYRADVAARLAGPRPAPGRWTPAAHGIPGEAVALLLDRMDAGWRERVAAGAPLLEVLLSATGLSPAEALARAPDAFRRGGFHAMLAELPPPAPPGADPAVSETFFLAALRTLAPGTPAIHIDLQTDRSPAGEPGLEYRAGPAGAAVPAPGFVLLPDPAWVRVRAGNVDLEVRGHPVALITTPGIAWQSVRVIVYPRVDLTDVVPVRLPYEDDRPYHVRVEGIDLRIGRGAHVCPCAEIYIRPAP